LGIAAFISLWSHAMASAAFAALSLWQARRAAIESRGHMLALAFALTSLWALAVSVAGPLSAFAAGMESARNIGWLGFMLILFLGGHHGPQRRPVMMLYAVLALVTASAAPLIIMALRDYGDGQLVDALFYTAMTLRMTFAVGGLLLVHNLYGATSPDGRRWLVLPAVALAAMWTYDLNLYITGYLNHDLSPLLLALRGTIMVMLVPLFVLASRRIGAGRLQLSRRLTFQSLSLVAVGFYLACMVVATRAIEAVGGSYAEMAVVAVVFGMSMGAMLLLPSHRVRAWLKVKIAKHFFQHRYDYREQWLRFNHILSRTGGAQEPIAGRVLEAIAGITDSPGGALFVPDEAGRLKPAARRHWPSSMAEDYGDAQALVAWLEQTGRVIEFGAVRAGEGGDIGEDGDALALPPALIDEPLAWAGVPLIHGERLFGLVVLQPPAIERALDWEDFDLLKVVGREAASYLAEAQGQAALSDARRFDEFNRRFAFIMHDIKNLVSQLSLVARNAERHADNPAFRADMVMTLRSSVDKMNDLLARLAQHHQPRADEPRAMPLKSLIEDMLRPRMAVAPVRLGAMADLDGLVDPPRLEQALLHLVQNALDASPAGVPVEISLGAEGGMARIEIRDRGAGMTPDFIQNQLYRPFHSTKADGFGIGAYEARSLVQAMGGRIELVSQLGEGSCFAILLPLARLAGAHIALDTEKVG
jgi:putative PEP-CTERM system histidine kinase